MSSSVFDFLLKVRAPITAELRGPAAGGERAAAVLSVMIAIVLKYFGNTFWKHMLPVSLLFYRRCSRSNFMCIVG